MTWSRDLKLNGKNCLLIFPYSPLIQSTTWRFQALDLTLHLAAFVVVSTQANDQGHELFPSTLDKLSFLTIISVAE
ncbi:hypothetical protein I7I48_05240 [Histoplasma ohiense]|nr:hypothetical protein I7I48_05240 [Histoplasma ohiense (nom. inval.)]